jgi:hypothetical protein
MVFGRDRLWAAVFIVLGLTTAHQLLRHCTATHVLVGDRKSLSRAEAMQFIELSTERRAVRTAGWNAGNLSSANHGDRGSNDITAETETFPSAACQGVPAEFGCTCQGISNMYGVTHPFRATLDRNSVPPAAREFWQSNKCSTTPVLTPPPKHGEEDAYVEPPHNAVLNRRRHCNMFVSRVCSFVRPLESMVLQRVSGQSLELRKVQAVGGDPRGRRSVKTAISCPRICVLIHLDILLKLHTNHAC